MADNITVTQITQPPANQTVEVPFDKNTQLLLQFSLDGLYSVSEDGGDLVLEFDNDARIVIDGYRDVLGDPGASSFLVGDVAMTTLQFANLISLGGEYEEFLNGASGSEGRNCRADFAGY